MLWKKNKHYLLIEPYRGYGSGQRIYLRGRILTDKGIEAEQGESFWNKLIDNFNRFDSNEIPNIPLHIKFDAKVYHTHTDREGFFLLDLEEGPPLEVHETWKQIRIIVEKLQDKKWSNSKIESIGEIMMPSSQAKFGVISDIDDTILKTDVAFKARAVSNTIFKNPYDRQQLKGMSSWIKGLHHNVNQSNTNPIFYVSKSPRNIYKYLSKFLSYNQFPKGPILLRDFGRQVVPRSKDYPGHKKEEIIRILKSYPNLKFILVGDIAGDDPVLYYEIQQEFPVQVLAVYIRDINHRRKQKKFAQWLDKRSFPNLFVMKNALEGAMHAVDRGWIQQQTVEKIRDELNLHS